MESNGRSIALVERDTIVTICRFLAEIVTIYFEKWFTRAYKLPFCCFDDENKGRKKLNSEVQHFHGVWYVDSFVKIASNFFPYFVELEPYLELRCLGCLLSLR